MPEAEITAYIAGLEQPKRQSLETVRARILNILPDAEQTIAYGMPTFKVGGKSIASIAAFKSHLSYFPHSGSILAELGPEVAAMASSKGTLQFPVDKPLSVAVLQRLINARMAQLQRP